MKKCPKEIEHGTSHRYWVPCALPAGHCGACASEFVVKYGVQGSVAQSARVSYPVDANGAPL